MLTSRTICCLLIIATLFSLGCKKENSTDNKVSIFHVAPTLGLTGPRPPASSASPVNIPVMKIVEEGNKDTLYLTLDRIEGFSYEEGYKYTLKVSIRNIKNPPADGYIYGYKLIELQAKEKVAID